MSSPESTGIGDDNCCAEEEDEDDILNGAVLKKTAQTKAFLKMAYCTNPHQAQAQGSHTLESNLSS